MKDRAVFRWARRLLSRVVSSPGISVHSGLRYWQERMLATVLVVGVGFGLLVYPPSIWLAIHEGRPELVVADTVILLLAVGLLVFKDIRFWIRASVVVGLCYLLGLELLVVLGPYGAGPVWLFAAPVLAGVLLGMRGAWYLLALNAVTLTVFCILIGLGEVSVAPTVEHPLEKWIVICLNFMLLDALAAICVSLPLKGLNRTLKDEQSAREALAEKHDELFEAHRALRGANRSLETAIRESDRLSIERDEVQQQLQQAQKLETVGRLAGGIAHDFNNLVTIINSYAEFAGEGLREGDPLRSDLQEIEDAGRRAADLTRKLLAFSRKQVLESRALDLNAVVAGMESMVRRLVGEDIELRAVLDRRIGMVNADPGQIEQVLMNLAVNARDAMPMGGKITIETADVELDEEYVDNHAGAVAGPHVMLAVTDTGEGMIAEIRERVFEPFFTTKEKGRGTGLGLATVYGIIKQSGGDIWVYSEPGEGTTFKIYLPRLEDEEAPAPIHRDEPGELRGSETVLVVEDEPAVRELARRILKSAGYRPLVAASGGEALLEHERHPGPIHLVLTDVVMPQMSGKDLAQRLESLSPGIRVLYMSGYTDDAIVHHGVLDAGTHFIAKPFNASALLKKVREVLEQGQASPASAGPGGEPDRGGEPDPDGQPAGGDGQKSDTG